MSSKLEVVSVDLWANQSKPAVAISADVLALGRQWVQVCVEQGGVIQAWFSKVDEKTKHSLDCGLAGGYFASPILSSKP